MTLNVRTEIFKMRKQLPKIIGNLLNGFRYFSEKNAAKIALYLFSKPRKGQIKPQHQKFLNSGEISTFAFNEHNIKCYHWKGSGPCVLLIQGWESNSARWKKYIKSLQDKKYTVVALDAPAHGGSTSNTFDAILYASFIDKIATNFKPEFFVAHSIGCMSLVYFLKKTIQPSPKKIVLIGGPSKFEIILNRYQNIMGYSEALMLALNKIITHKFGNPPSYYNTANFGFDLNCEVLIIHDVLDPIIPYDEAINLNKTIKNSTLHTTKFRSHSLNNNEVVEKTITFIEH